MNGRIKTVTMWSTLGGVGILTTVLALTGQSARTQTTDPVPPVERVSIRSDGGQANSNSSGSATNVDGSCVAFYTDATNLLPQGPDADTNGYRDVYLYDRPTHAIGRVSLSNTGAQGNGPSQAQGFRPAVDADCTCVAFSSDATNLVSDDTNGRTDVFVRDLASSPASTLRASVGDGVEANGASSFPSVSADCQVIAFQSSASNLVPNDTNLTSDIFLYNRGTGLTSRVSVGAGGTQANGSSITPAISANGRCVAFASAASNLLPGDTNGTMDVYVACDGVVTCRASVDSNGAEGNDISFLPSLSADGNIVAFKSNASNLVSDDRNTVADVFVHNCASGETERVSVNSLGQESNDIAIPPTISGDGRFVAFGNFGSNLAPGQTTRGRSQVYVRDRVNATTSLISTNPIGGPGNNSVPDVPPSISQDGGFVAFASLASDLVPNDTNQALDAFIRANVEVAPVGTRTPTRTVPQRTATPTPTIPCDRDTDCPSGQVCSPDDVCVPAPTRTPTIACNDNEDCPSGLVCVSGVCRDLSTPTPTATLLPTCMMDADCLDPNDRCRAMVCVPERICDDTDPEVDRVNCRGVRETCLNGKCECGGDCNLDGIVFGTEITKMVCILGGACDIEECEAGDFDEPLDGTIMANEVTLAVTNLGLGCPGEGAPLIFAENRTDEPRSINIGSTSGIRGQFIDIAISLGGGGDVTTIQTDILFDSATLSIDDPGSACTIAPRLAGQFFPVAFKPQVPPAPSGQTRLRVAVLDLMFPLNTYTAGPVMTCRFRIEPGAALGASTLVGERFQIGDSAGNEFGASVAPGTVTVTETIQCPIPPEMCPDGTQCRDNTCQPIVECSGPTAGPEECQDGREACVDNQCECVGDCNGDGRVRSSEITVMISIINGQASIEQCLAADQNGDGRVRSSEITLAIRNINEGCP